jgi:hypothetical protein
MVNNEVLHSYNQGLAGPGFRAKGICQEKVFFSEIYQSKQIYLFARSQLYDRELQFTTPRVAYVLHFETKNIFFNFGKTL